MNLSECSSRRFRPKVNLLVNVKYILTVVTDLPGEPYRQPTPKLGARMKKSYSIYVSGPAKTSIKRYIRPLRAPVIDIHPNATWVQNGLTVAGGNGEGESSSQLVYPYGLYVDDDQTIYVTDGNNNRVMASESDANDGRVVAGGNGQGNGSHQLSLASDVIVDKQHDSLIICDCENNRVVQSRRRSGLSEVIISNISCWGLTMDESGSLYVVDVKKHEVRKYRREESQRTMGAYPGITGGYHVHQFSDPSYVFVDQGTAVAGGNGIGNRLDQLNHPSYVFVDQNHSVYVSDTKNHRVMKWEEGAKQGIVVAGGQGQGNNLTQLSEPRGVVVDQFGTIYVADYYNSRIMRWPLGATQGSVIAGGNDREEQSNQLYCFIGLSFDPRGNLYAADSCNHRVQKFKIEQTIN
ncbi:unnamed protein product [Adineta steineri]|uniref:Uncharacterized protein n=1 Tax=Adineta steineri TaxID=433720 RepID=A0A819UL39_9BILA|nr:unnamed protein product [Adineta steineri]